MRGKGKRSFSEEKIEKIDGMKSRMISETGNDSLSLDCHY
jgi:hypothetical protein